MSVFCTWFIFDGCIQNTSHWYHNVFYWITHFIYKPLADNAFSPCRWLTEKFPRICVTLECISHGRNNGMLLNRYTDKTNYQLNRALITDAPVIVFGDGHITLEKGTSLPLPCDAKSNPEPLNIAIYRDPSNVKGRYEPISVHLSTIKIPHFRNIVNTTIALFSWRFFCHREWPAPYQSF